MFGLQSGCHISSLNLSPSSTTTTSATTTTTGPHTGGAAGGTRASPASAHTSRGATKCTSVRRAGVRDTCRLLMLLAPLRASAGPIHGARADPHHGCSQILPQAVAQPADSGFAVRSPAGWLWNHHEYCRRTHLQCFGPRGRHRGVAGCVANCSVPPREGSWDGRLPLPRLPLPMLPLPRLPLPILFLLPPLLTKLLLWLI